MPSFQDSAVIFILALLILGPKKLPELAKQLGKIMGELRRASNEFKMQMEDEMRTSEREEQRKRVEAIVQATPENTIAPPALASTADEMAQPIQTDMHDSVSATGDSIAFDPPAAFPAQLAEPVAIADSGDLQMLPPPTGLPVGRGASGHMTAPEQIVQGGAENPEHEQAASHEESGQHA